MSIHEQKIAIFPTQWRANQQLAGGLSTCQLCFGSPNCYLYSLEVISQHSNISPPQLLGMKITDNKSILQQVVRTPTSWRWGGETGSPGFNLPSALDSLDHFNLPMGFGSPWQDPWDWDEFTYIISQIFIWYIPYMDPMSNDASGMMTNLRFYFWTSVGSFWLQEYDVDQYRSI